MSGQPGTDRLRILVEAGIALSSELSLDALLQRIVETAAELTGARYAALGVIDRSGQALERFLTTGVDAETHAAIGDLPRGRGILGVLIREARPLRLHDLARRPALGRLPPRPPADEDVPRRPDRAPRRRLREPLPHREGRAASTSPTRTRS